MAAEMDKHHARVAHRRRLGKLNRNLGRIANRRKQRFTPKVSCLGLFGLLDCWTDGSGLFVSRWDGFCLRLAPASLSTPPPTPLFRFLQCRRPSQIEYSVKRKDAEEIAARRRAEARSQIEVPPIDPLDLGPGAIGRTVDAHRARVCEPPLDAALASRNTNTGVHMRSHSLRTHSVFPLFPWVAQSRFASATVDVIHADDLLIDPEDVSDADLRQKIKEHAIALAHVRCPCLIPHPHTSFVATTHPLPFSHTHPNPVRSETFE